MSHYCETCSKTFASEQAANQHMNDTDHWAPTFHCDTCQKEFYSQHAANQHMNDTDHWTPTFECETCDKEFYSQHAANQHMNDKSHWADTSSCETADNTIDSKQTADQYMDGKAQQAQVFPCDRCDEAFDSKEDAARHMNTKSHWAPTCFCEFCNKQFSSESAAAEHMDIWGHRRWRDLNSYPCETCDDLLFPTQEAANRHMDVMSHWLNPFATIHPTPPPGEYTLGGHTRTNNIYQPGAFGSRDTGMRAWGKPPHIASPQDSKDQGTPRGRRNYDDYEELKPVYSSAKIEWDREKRRGAKNDALDSLMGMIGLEEVKAKFLSIKSEVETSTRQGINIRGDRLNCVMLGNPGTGKTTVARLYAQFLTSLGVVTGSKVVETTGSSLANSGVEGCEEHIKSLLARGGGVMFIDEAYQLTADHSPLGGVQALDHILSESENLRGKIVFVVAGYNRDMETFFAHNRGLQSRFPCKIQFNNFDDDDLTRILALKVEKKWEGRMEVEKGPGGLFSRIVARRIGRGRSSEGFGNARTVESYLGYISQRQSTRLKREQAGGWGQASNIDVMMLTKEDLLGPNPSVAGKNCNALVKLQKLVGLKVVKDAVKALCNTIQINYDRELREEPLIKFSLNRVFLGNPGTGKTSVAKLYGEILKDLGMLSDGEVVVKKPVDFIGEYIGESENKTKAILASTVGKVLVIDEFYGLYGGKRSNGADSYGRAVIDTIVAEVQVVAGDDRCVLLLGYKDEIETMFQDMNPGLSRRFSLDSAFVFDDFTEGELRQILNLKMKDQGLNATSGAMEVALTMLRRARNQPHFGNAGEIDNLLNKAKINQMGRISSSGTRAASTLLEPQDFDPQHDRGEKAEQTIREMFKGVVGCENIIAKLEGYQRRVKSLRELGLDPTSRVPFGFLFRGPPGSGKTTTARKMGRIYYELGILATPDVEECSTTHMIAEYVGQTGPKTRALLEKSLGKVLLIDEAYRLAQTSSDHYNPAKEALDELVSCMTDTKFYHKIVVILAGYDAEINHLVQQNPGLSSRFPEAFVFGALAIDSCVELMCKELESYKKQVVEKGNSFDISPLERPSPPFRRILTDRFDMLRSLPNWASARDIQTISGEIFNKALEGMGGSSHSRLLITEGVVVGELDAMIAERRHRALSADLSPRARRSEKLGVPPQHPLQRTTLDSAVESSSHLEAKTGRRNYKRYKSSERPSTHQPATPGLSSKVLRPAKSAAEFLYSNVEAEPSMLRASRWNQG